MKPLIAIVTCHRFKSRADTQRQTWIPMMEEVPKDQRIDIKFFLGRGDRESLPDEVFLDVPDDYDSLPFKVREVMKWALKNGYDTVFKCDDDVYVFPERLVNILPTTPYEGKLNHSQYKVAPLGWCSGFAYWLTGDALRIIANAPDPDHKSEDLWVGKTLSKHGIACKVVSQFLVLCILPRVSWRSFRKQVIVALATEDTMADMHNVLRDQVSADDLPVTSNRSYRMLPIRKSTRFR